MIHDDILAAMDRIPRGPTPYARACTTANAALPLYASAAELLKQIKRALAEVPPEPLGEWMREQGFPPEACTLVLPERMRAELGPFWPKYVQFWPKYVQFSQHIHTPTLVRLKPDAFGHPAPTRPLDLGPLR